MASLPFALSVSHFINSVGAKAGFAAIIGLALLVLLFFAQMRETAHLRDEAEAAAEHVRQLEQRLATLARGMASGQARSAQAGQGIKAGRTAGPAVAPRPAAAGAAAAAGGAVASRSVAMPIAPAGVGAPALASATRLIPAFDDGPISVRHGGPAAATAEANGQDAESGRGGAAVMAPPGPPPATAAGGGNGSSSRPAPPPVGPAGRPGQGQRPAPAAAAPRSPVPPSRTNYGPEPTSRWRALTVGLIALAVVGAVVVVLLLLTGGSSSPSSSASSSQAISNAPRRHRRSTKHAALPKPATVTVAVLNGTSTNQLAHDVSQKLAGAGFKLGTIATANDQTHTSTIVGYQPGRRADAEAVAKALGLPASSVSGVDQPSLQVACPGAGACAAQVIVTAGADLASVASSSSSSAAPAAGATTTG